MPYIGSSRYKYAPYLTVNMARTEQVTYIPDQIVTSSPWPNFLSSAFGTPSVTKANFSCDSAFSSVSIILPMNGTNGSTTFTDFSLNPKTMTANGNAQISTAQSKWGGSSGLFDGTGDYLSTPGSADFNFGTAPFTIEFWIRSNTTQVRSAVVGQVPANGTTNGGWYITTRIASGSNLQFTYFNGTTFVDFAASPSVGLNSNTWRHVAVCRDGVNLYLVSDGSLRRHFTTFSASQAIGSNSIDLNIGWNLFNNTYYNGYINDLRITKGICRYTGIYTVPTAAFPTNVC